MLCRCVACTLQLVEQRIPKCHDSNRQAALFCVDGFKVLRFREHQEREEEQGRIAQAVHTWLYEKLEPSTK